MGRARLVALSVGAASLAPTLFGAARPAAAAVPVIEIDGRGFGHGVGMAQDGALEMGRRGMSLSQILGQFYPGTSYAHASGDVRVPVLTTVSAAAVTFPDGGQVVDALSGPQSAGFPLSVPPGGAVTFTWDGSRYGVAPVAGTSSSTTTTRPRTTTTVRRTTTTVPLLPIPTGPTHAAFVDAAPGGGASSSRPLWAVPTGSGAIGVPDRGRAYRGVVEASGSPGTLRLINQVDVETYLVGMGEVQDPSWPLAALEAQEVAARTYALRAMGTGGELCDDTRCQVYLGADGEYPAAQRAVAATAGTVLMSGGSLIDAVYSSNAAGFSASRLEGFGVDDSGYPYLRPARYPSSDQVPWTVQVASADIVSRLRLSGPLTNLLVTSKGPSGRALALAVAAGGKTTSISGLDFAAALGLRSTMIDAIRATVASVAPPPPLTAALQVLPGNAGDVAAAATASQATTTSTQAPLFGAALGAPVPTGATLPTRSSARVPVALSLVAALLLVLVAVAAGRERGHGRRTLLSRVGAGRDREGQDPERSR